MYQDLVILDFKKSCSMFFSHKMGSLSCPFKPVQNNKFISIKSKTLGVSYKSKGLLVQCMTRYLPF